MNKLIEAFETANKAGHTLIHDPPTNSLSSVHRYTCTKCGRAVLGTATHAYGSAIQEQCVPYAMQTSLNKDGV